MGEEGDHEPGEAAGAGPAGRANLCARLRTGPSPPLGRRPQAGTRVERDWPETPF